MINFKELRIGNLLKPLFNNDVEYCKVKGIDEEYIYSNAISFDYTGFDEFKPIPLTEEWLIKFGFKKYSKNFIKYGDIEFYIWTTNNDYQIKALDKLIKIETVHELQNLYYLLTKTELFYE
jgi:hypothetical protein